MLNFFHIVTNLIKVTREFAVPLNSFEPPN